MPTLQNQITQSLEGLSDDSLRFILDMIQRFVLPSESRSVSINYGVVTQGKKRRLGSMKGQKFIADGHDIDECNDEIARWMVDEDFAGYTYCNMGSTGFGGIVEYSHVRIIMSL